MNTQRCIFPLAKLKRRNILFFGKKTPVIITPPSVEFTSSLDEQLENIYDRRLIKVEKIQNRQKNNLGHVTSLAIYIAYNPIYILFYINTHSRHWRKKCMHFDVLLTYRLSQTSRNRTFSLKSICPCQSVRVP